MRQICKFIVLILFAALFTVGCSNDNSAEQTISSTSSAVNSTEESSDQAESLSRGEYKASDYVMLTAYKNLEVQKSDLEVEDDEVQDYVKQLISNNMITNQIKDRVVEDGDTVNIDYVGKKDGVAFDGGTAQGYDLTIGSNSFIDGFEEGLIGVKPGETTNLNLTFPEDYQSEELAGQDVVFEVTVNYIAESVEPEYTDEFVQSVTEYSNIKDYEQSVKDSLYESKLEQELAAKMLENCTVEDYPDSLLAYYENMLINYTKQMASLLGYSYEDYLSNNNYTEDTFQSEYVEPNSQIYAKQDLAIEFIAEQEGIDPSADDYDTVLEEYAEEAGMEIETLKQYPQEELNEIYIRQKVLKLMADNAVIK